MQRAIGNCLATVGFGVVGGAILGAVLGNNAGQGAVFGAAVGAGACAVLLKVASDEDQAKMRQFEQQAVAASAMQTQTFVTKSGQAAIVTTNVIAADVRAPKLQGSTAASQKFTDCRYANQSVQINGQTTGVDKQLWCRLDTGDWQPVAS